MVGAKMEKRLIDVEKSARLAGELGAYEDFCWFNAIGTMFLEDMNAIYVEGAQIFTGADDLYTRIWEHGWLEENGIIVDPYPRVDWERDEYIYFPAAKYTKLATGRLMRRQLPPFSRSIESPFHVMYWKVEEFAREVFANITGETYDEARARGI